MKKNNITNKITPCCGLPFSVAYWWIENLTLNSDADRVFIRNKLHQNGTIGIDAWKVLINSGTLEADASLTKAEFLAWFDCERQPSCEQLKLLIEAFKIGNYNPLNEYGVGWTEISNFEIYNGKIIKKIVGYSGGIGTIPDELQQRIGKYYSDNANLTDNKNLAVDFKGQSGANGTTNLTQFANLSFPVTNTATEKVQCVKDFVFYQLADGQTSSITDIPGISPKWIAIRDEKTYNEIYRTGATEQKYGVDVVDRTSTLSPVNGLWIQKGFTVSQNTKATSITLDVKTAGNITVILFRLIESNYVEQQRVVISATVGVATYPLDINVLSGDIFGVSGALSFVPSSSIYYRPPSNISTPNLQFTKSGLDSATTTATISFQITLASITKGILQRLDEIPSDFNTIIKQADLTVVASKNLYLTKYEIANKGVNNLGVIVDQSGWIYIRVPAKSATVYSIFSTGGYPQNNVGRMLFQNSAGANINSVDMSTFSASDSGKGKKFTTPVDTAFICVNVKVFADYRVNFQLEEGSSFTGYEAGIELIQKIKNLEIKSQSQTSKLINRRFVFFGDSITDASFSRWFEKFLVDYSMKSIINLARSGATWSHTSTTEYNITETGGSTTPNNVIANQVNKLIDGVTNGNYQVPEVAVFFAGTNDLGRTQGSASTAYDFSVDYSALAMNDVLLQNIAGATRYSVEKLMTVAPKIKIVFVTPIYRGAVSNTTLVSIRDLIVACANKVSAPVIDLMYTSGIYPLPDIGSNHKFLADNLHPNVDGGIMLSDEIGHFLYNRFS